MGSVAFVTIVAKNYLSFARVLARDLHRHHPDADCFVALADDVDGYFDPAVEMFKLLTLTDLGIAHLNTFTFRFGFPVLAVAIKPFVLAHLLDRYSNVVFLDADMLVLDHLGPLLANVQEHAVVLTPHLLDPLEGPDRVERELEVLKAGCFNAGVVGVSDTPEAWRFLSWWQDRVSQRCEHDVAHGVLLDQRWLDLAPAYFDDVHCLREPGINVAHWNLCERSVSIHGLDILVNGQPCRLLHASGFDPEQPHVLTRHATTGHLGRVGPVAALLARFRSRLDDSGYQETKSWPYAFASFGNGVAIPGLAREIYRALGDSAERFGDPSDAHRSGNYFRWLTEPGESDVDARHPLTRLWRSVWESRLDVQRAYPDPSGDDHHGYIRWLRSSSGPEHGLAPELRPAP